MYILELVWCKEGARSAKPSINDERNPGEKSETTILKDASAINKLKWIYKDMTSDKTGSRLNWKMVQIELNEGQSGRCRLGT